MVKKRILAAICVAAYSTMAEAAPPPPPQIPTALPETHNGYPIRALYGAYSAFAYLQLERAVQQKIDEIRPKIISKANGETKYRYGSTASVSVKTTFRRTIAYWYVDQVCLLGNEPNRPRSENGVSQSDESLWTGACTLQMTRVQARITGAPNSKMPAIIENSFDADKLTQFLRSEGISPDSISKITPQLFRKYQDPVKLLKRDLVQSETFDLTKCQGIRTALAQIEKMEIRPDLEGISTDRPFIYRWAEPAKYKAKLDILIPQSGRAKIEVTNIYEGLAVDVFRSFKANTETCFANQSVF